ncbi:MAG: hypothetical protein AAF773_05880 [Cyanobacteria bacterium P01_D01_bin.115]
MQPNNPKSRFKLIFASVLALTLTSGGTALHLANQPTPTEAQDRIFDSAIAMWTMGTTTLIGLLSSRSDDDNE